MPEADGNRESHREPTTAGQIAEIPVQKPSCAGLVWNDNWHVGSLLADAGGSIISQIGVRDSAMTERDGVTRRRIVEVGGGLLVIGGLGGIASAAEHDEPEDEVAPTDEDEPEDEGEPTDEDEPEELPDEARIRAAHLSPDAPAVDVYVDGELVLEEATYTTVSDYLEFEPGSYTVAVVPAGETPEEAVIEETVDVEEGDYTVAAIGEVAAQNQPLQALELEDDNTPPGEGMARVRGVHAAPDAPAVDIVVEETGDALFEDVAFGDAADVEVPEGDYTLLIYPAGERDEPAFEAAVSVVGGTIYSAFAIGYLDPAAAPVDEPFDVLVTEDAVPET